MNITTIIGLILSVVGLLGGMHFKHVPFSALGNPAAIFMILIGTTGAVLNAFPLKDAKNIGKLFGMVFTDKKTVSNIDLINQIMEYAYFARKEGMISLESKIDAAPNPFLKRGLSLLVSGMSSDSINDIMAEEIAAMEKRHAANAQIFTQAGTYAPTLGVLGAVVGLIAAMGNMSDQAALGNAISAAFMATIYGIFTGYVLWHPFANKLKRKSKYEALTNTIIMEGIMCLVGGESPIEVEEKCITFLSLTEREKYLKQKTKG